MSLSLNKRTRLCGDDLIRKLKGDMFHTLIRWKKIYLGCHSFWSSP